MPAGEERPRLAPVPPHAEDEGGSGPAPRKGPGRTRLLALALAAAVLLAAVGFVGWIGAESEVGRLESALADRERALESARAELRGWERHRDAVGTRLESLSGELEALRALVARGPESEGPASAEPSDAPTR